MFDALMSRARFARGALRAQNDALKRHRNGHFGKSRSMHADAMSYSTHSCHELASLAARSAREKEAHNGGRNGHFGTFRLFVQNVEKEVGKCIGMHSEHVLKKFIFGQKCRKNGRKMYWDAF